MHFLRLLVLCAVIYFANAEILRLTIDGAAITSSSGSVSPSSIRSGTATVIVRLLATSGGDPSSVFSENLTVYPRADEVADSPIIVFSPSLSSQINPAIENGDIRVKAARDPQDFRRMILNITGGSYYGFSTETMHVTLLRNSLNPIGEAVNVPLSLKVQIPAENTDWHKPMTYALPAAAGGSLLLSLVTKDSHMGLLSITRQAVLERALHCNDDLNYVLHPTKMTVGFGFSASLYLGSLLLNISMLIFIMGLHVAVLRRIPGAFAPHFPGDHWQFVMFFLCGISVATMTTMITTEAPVRWALALVILGMYYMALLICFYLSSDKQHMFFVEKYGKWIHRQDKTFVQRWRMMYEPYRPGLQAALLVEVVLTVILCVFSSTKRHNDTMDGCNLKSLASICVIGLELLFLVVTRPYRSIGDTISVICFRLLEAGTAVCAFLASGDPSPTSVYVVVGEFVVMSGCAVPFIRYTVVAFQKFCKKPGIDDALAEFEEVPTIATGQSLPAPPPPKQSSASVVKPKVRDRSAAEPATAPAGAAPVSSKAEELHAASPSSGPQEIVIADRAQSLEATANAEEPSPASEPLHDVSSAPSSSKKFMLASKPKKKPVKNEDEQPALEVPLLAHEPSLSDASLHRAPSNASPLRIPSRRRRRATDFTVVAEDGVLQLPNRMEGEVAEAEMVEFICEGLDKL